MSGRFPVPRKGFGALFRLLGQSDEVVSQTRFFPLTPIVAYLAAARGRRIAIVDHGSGHFRFASPVLDALSIGYEHGITAALALVRPRYFGVSAASVQWLRHFGIRSATVLPNGIDMRETPLPARSAEDYGNPTVLYAGRLIPEKGVRELIAGFCLWRERSGRRGTLRVAGEGSLQTEVAATAGADPGVIFLGKLAPARVAEELDRAHILINPSNYPEGLPTVLLEAGRAALAVISTPNGGSAELIDGAQTGWLIERGTPVAIADALDEIVSQPLEALRRGRNLYGVVAERHSWPSIVSQYAKATS